MDREELHRRLMLLKAELEAGTVHIPDGEFVEALSQVRYAPDGLVDMATVHASVRALAGAVTGASHMDDLRAIPLREIQQAYFALIERFFSRPFEEMRRNNVTPHQVASQMAAQPRFVDAFRASADEFFNGVTEFWNAYGPSAELHIQEGKWLRAVFGGDISPSYTTSLASAGVYLDTIIVPDPLLRLSTMRRGLLDKQLFYFVVKHSLNLLSNKDLALADVDPPILVVGPDAFSLGHTDIVQASDADILAHSSKLFGTTFESQDRLLEYLAGIDDSGELASRVADPQRLLFDVDWTGTIADQMARHQREILSRFDNMPVDTSKAGEAVRLVIAGRMMQANDVVQRALRFGAIPFVDAPTSWQYLLWKYEYDRERSLATDKGSRDMLIARAITCNDSEDLKLLGALAPHDVIDLRKRGALAEFREMLRHGIDDVHSASPESLVDVTQAVAGNVSGALLQHAKDLSSLRSSKLFFGVNVASCIFIGGMSIAAATTGIVDLGIAAAAAAVSVGAPSLREVSGKGKRVLEDGSHLKRSPGGLLVRLKERTTRGDTARRRIGRR